MVWKVVLNDDSWLAASEWTAWRSLLAEILNQLAIMFRTDERDQLSLWVENTLSSIDNTHQIPSNLRKSLSQHLGDEIAEINWELFESLAIIPSEWANEIRWVPELINFIKRECSLVEEVHPWQALVTQISINKKPVEVLFYHIHIRCWERPWPEYMQWLYDIGIELGLNPSKWTCLRKNEIDDEYIGEVETWTRHRRLRRGPQFPAESCTFHIDGPGARVFITLEDWWRPEQDAEELEELQPPRIPPA